MPPNSPPRKRSPAPPPWAAEISSDVKELKDCIIGTTEKPGIVARMMELERWKNNEAKVLTTIIVSLTLGIITLLFEHILNGG